MFSKLKQRWSNLKLNKKITLIIIIFLIIPIITFCLLLFNVIEDSSISKKLNSMDYYMNKNYDQILKNVNSINMATQFILSDQDLIDYLNLIKSNQPVSTEEVLNFYKNNVSFLERMVNNNPYLYQIRVYVDSDNMVEMNPILYRMDRMKKLAWANDEKLEGWKFDYTDTIFDSYVLSQNKKIMSLLTPVYDFSKGQIGLIEAAMYMETMFPGLYEESDDEWNYFVDDDGNIYYGNKNNTDTKQYIDEVWDSIKKDNDTTGAYYTKIDGKSVVVGFVQAKEISGTLICIKSAEKELHQLHNLRNLFIIIIIFILLLLCIISNAVIKKILKQLYVILDSMRKVQKGDLDVVIDVSRMDEMGELAQQFNKMLTKIRLLMEENVKREILAKNSEIKALQNQINAHFIYNVLESIKMMAEIEEKYEISDAVTILGKLLRYSMKWDSKTVTVKEEIDYIKNYLSLINLRFDYEIYLSTNIPDIIYKQQIPKMSLQPIVENAIYHGIEQIAEDTNIYIKGYVDGDGDCVIEITDAGRGMTEEEVNNLYKKLAGEIEVSGGTGNGIGLKNVQDRIKMFFGDKYGIDIFSKLGCYTKIKVRIPLTVKEGVD